MNETPIPVRLHGPLAEIYGHEHRFAVSTPREAVLALCANNPGFRQDFLDTGRWAILADGDWREGDDAPVTPVSREIDLVPIIEGQAFLGALLVGALIPSLAGTAAANIIGGLLVGALLLGVSLLLTPKQPKKPEADDEKDDNYSFSGPENITTQGAPVPILYGRAFAGSVVVSAGLELAEEFRPTTGGGETAGASIVAGGAPAITNQTINGTVHRGPAGWKYIGVRSILNGSSYVSVDYWLSPNLAYKWDRIRGFASASSGAL